MGLTERLIRLRRRQRLSQVELARRAGLSVRTIRNLEHGVTRPQLATIRALAAGLRLTDDEREHLENEARRFLPDGRRSHDPGGLPAPASPLIGRREELTALVHLVRDAPERAVTVVGPGGVGKSRLALEVAWQLVDAFEHIDVIDLVPLRSRDEALGALAAAAGAGTVAAPEAIARRIGQQKRLLVLDSIEHVAEVGPDLAFVLERCPRLRLLITGRVTPSPAGVVWPLDPLPLPDPAITDPAAALANPAVELLVARARALRPTFDLDASTVESAVTICRRLDGLPLAIELAAGQLGDRDVRRVAAELSVRTLQTDLLDVPPRHRTLHDAVAWSTALLAEADRLAFYALGVFRGRTTVEALAAVVRALPAELPDKPDELMSGPLSRLAAVSLLRLADGPAPAVEMLDTIREIARDGLRDAGLADACRHAHARYMLDLLRGGDKAAVDGQFDDIRAAVEFACAQAPHLLDRTVVSALADALIGRGRFEEAHTRLSAVAAATIPTWLKWRSCAPAWPPTSRATTQPPSPAGEPWPSEADRRRPPSTSSATLTNRWPNSTSPSRPSASASYRRWRWASAGT